MLDTDASGQLHNVHNDTAISKAGGTYVETYLRKGKIPESVGVKE